MSLALNVLNSPSIVKSNNLNDFIKLIDKIYNSIEKKEKKNFWDIISEYPQYSLNILNNVDGYMNEYHIHNILIF